MRFFSALLVPCFLATILAAQEPVITPDMQVTTEILHQWLHSGDPRLITWTADFARRTHDAQIIAEMPGWLEHWPMPPVYGDLDRQESQRRIPSLLPILAVLDTLIQENAQVPIPAIDSFAVSFPFHASILMARHPLSESRPYLEEWARGANGINAQRYLAKVAFMILAKNPGASTQFWYGDTDIPLGLVGSVVAASHSKLNIAVNADGAPEPLTGGAACGDSPGREPSRGWPPVYDYVILEYDKDPNKPVLVELGDYRLSVWRAESNGAALGSCHGSLWLDPDYLFNELIAYWLAIKPQDMPWRPEQSFGIKWVTTAEYEHRLGGIIESQRKKLRATVEALHKRGLLTDDQASDVIPKLVVNIQCDLRPCPLKMSAN
jgi:hypothetical protein